MAMDEETRQAFADLEARLMSRINGSQEAVLERLTRVDLAQAGLTEICRSTNTLLSLMATMIGGFDRRITDLEKKA